MFLLGAFCLLTFRIYTLKFITESKRLFSASQDRSVCIHTKLEIFSFDFLKKNIQ